MGPSIFTYITSLNKGSAIRIVSGGFILDTAGNAFPRVISLDDRKVYILKKQIPWPTVMRSSPKNHFLLCEDGTLIVFNLEFNEVQRISTGPEKCYSLEYNSYSDTLHSCDYGELYSTSATPPCEFSIKKTGLREVKYVGNGLFIGQKDEKYFMYNAIDGRLSDIDFNPVRRILRSYLTDAVYLHDFSDALHVVSIDEGKFSSAKYKIPFGKKRAIHLCNNNFIYCMDLYQSEGSLFCIYELHNGLVRLRHCKYETKIYVVKMFAHKGNVFAIDNDGHIYSVSEPKSLAVK